jgi:methylthioribulose-1-phosphate dehydratase
MTNPQIEITNQQIQEAQALLAQTSRDLYHRGYSDATSSNYSIKLSDNLIAISSSGIHKGKMLAQEIMLVDLAGKPVDSQLKPSAETLLHCQVYQEFPEMGCVLHTHSVAMTVLGRLTKGNVLRLEHYEMLKALEGIQTHEVSVDFPIVENDQDMKRLSETLKPFFERKGFWGYLIRGHGIYTWGKNLSVCLRQIEALEFIGKCELEMLKFNHQ